RVRAVGVHSPACSKSIVNQVRCFRGLGVPQEGSFNASEASSIGGHSHSPLASTPHPPELTRRPLRGHLAPVESAQALKPLPSTPRTAETDINHLVGQRSHASTV